MKTLFLALSLMAATIMPSFAANEHEVYGMAFNQCSETSKLAKQGILGRLVVTSFVGGYLSATNAFSAEHNAAHGREIDDIVTDVVTYCRKHPKEQGENAILQVLIDTGTAYNDE